MRTKRMARARGTETKQSVCLQSRPRLTALHRLYNHCQPISSSSHSQRPWPLGRTCTPTVLECLKTGPVVVMVGQVLQVECPHCPQRHPVCPLGHRVAHLSTSILLHLASEGRRQTDRLLVSHHRPAMAHPGRASSAWRLVITGWVDGPMIRKRILWSQHALLPTLRKVLNYTHPQKVIVTEGHYLPSGLLDNTQK
jgi:hypothetical protein